MAARRGRPALESEQCSSSQSGPGVAATGYLDGGVFLIFHFSMMGKGEGGARELSGLTPHSPTLCRGNPPSMGLCTCGVSIPAPEVKRCKGQLGATTSSMHPSHSGCCSQEWVLGTLSPPQPAPQTWLQVPGEALSQDLRCQSLSPSWGLWGATCLRRGRRLGQGSLLCFSICF